MRYRQLDADGDYQLGGNAVFLVDSPAAVAQAIQTRLGLIAGEWFLDQTAGTPYNTDILGAGTESTRDMAVQTAILDTQGVTGIADYASYLDPATRQFTVAATVDTQYGQTTITQTF
ncbi:hypothetical protein G3N58_17560 [Paraburkholderia sp. Ac-20342]|uniref:hypothetical protein n=1 Tax=Paraburkholderia sp. Ac-20342 TaxID=2703889 RepID=UPI00197F3287|nr:hypothetical protein [Paraburkholderia sp. Ac-20342]MBN3848615.1 hypothetical protein [Paraburkholderia sp. Ac-20342]